MVTTISQINPSMDLKVGPTYDYMVRPVPPELAFTEAQVDRVLQFYSASFPIVASPTEARDFANNFGISINLGSNATVTIVFFRNSAPPAGATLTIPVGTLVGTQDLTLIYRAVESKTMFGDFAATYFNPTSNRYEITLIAQAIAPGIVYNVPPLKITKVLTSQLDFDGIRQPAAATGGAEAETSTDLVNRVIQQFKGLNLGSIAGVVGLVKRFLPANISDAAIIRPTDRLEFRRPTTGPALDLCVSGSVFDTFSGEFLAVGGETSIPISTKTSIGVSSVSVNGASLSADLWTFVPDTTPEYQNSTRAKPVVNLVTPLLQNDIVDYVGTANILLDRLQVLFTPGDEALFETDVLVRSFVNLNIVVGVEIRIKSSPNFNANDTLNSATAFVSDYIQPTTVPATLSADGLERSLRANLQDIDSIKVFTFRRRFKSIEDVEVITPLKNEIPVYDATASSIIVKT